MKSLLIVALYTLAAVAAGNVLAGLLTSLTPRSQRIVAAVPLSARFALGSASLAGLWQLMALSGMLRSGAIWLVVILLCAVTVRDTLRLSTSLPLQRALAAVLKASNQGWAVNLMALALLALTVWLGVLAFLRPPFGDADAFYFVYPKIIAATGQLSAMEGSYRDFSAIGLSGELHFAALMVIGTPEGAKLFAWVTGVALIILLRDVTKATGGGVIAQVVAMAMLVTSTTFTDYLSDGKVDLFAACTALAAVLCLLGAGKSMPEHTGTVIAGLLTGFSVTAKFSYIVAFLPAVMLLLLFHALPNIGPAPLAGRFRKVLIEVGPFIAGLLIALLPHLLKNYVLFDQPLAPFIGMKGNWADQNWISAADAVWVVATYPFALAFGMYPMQGGNLSVLWLAALPLAFFLPRPRWSSQSFCSTLVQVTVSACVGLTCWLLIKASVFAPRYILVTLVMLIPLPAIAVEYVWHHESRPRLISFAFMVLTGIAMVAVPNTPPAGDWASVPRRIVQHVKTGFPECGLAISTYCHGFTTLSTQVREGERVFVAGYYTYWLRPDLLQCINEPGDYGIFNLSSPSDIWSALYSNGFSHVAVQKYSHGQYMKLLDPAKAPPWLKVTTGLVDSDMPVFHLESLDPTRRPGIVCARKGRSSWAPAPMPPKAL
jgi:hypothetical protein